MPIHRAVARLSVVVAAASAACALSACTRHAGFRSEQGYSLMPPPGWEVSTKSQPTLDVVARAPRENNFNANLNVTVTGAESGATPDAALQQIQQVYPRIFQDYRMASHAVVPVDGTRALDVTGSYTLPGTGQRIWLRQVIAAHGGKNYAFSCTALDDSHARYAPLFSSSLASIRWR
jgi:hypothetical protein